MMADKDPVNANLESPFESDVSLAKEDLNQSIIPESDSDVTQVSGSSSGSGSCNKEKFSETTNEVLSDTVSADTCYKTKDDAVKWK